MPRVHRIKTTTIHLPNVPPTSASSSKRVEPPTLEVLMMAQKIAQERGQVFDIEAFLTPSMREQWTAITRGQPWPCPVTQESSEAEAGPSTMAASPSKAAVDIKTEEPGHADVEQNNGEAPTDVDQTTVNSAVPSTIGDTVQAPTVEETPAPTLATPQKQPFKLHANSPALLNLHWKQRQKRLQQLAIREAAIERGEEPEYFPELEALIRGEEEREKEKEREEEVGQKRKRGLTEGDKDGIRASASHWNHLLIEARRARGPQWDYNTQLFLVDKASPQYFTHGKPPPVDEVEDAKPVQSHQATSNGIHPHPVDHITSSASSSSRPLPPHRESSSPVKPEPRGTPMPERRPSATPNSYPVPLPQTAGTPVNQSAPTPHMANGMNGATPSPRPTSSGHLPPHMQHQGYAGSPSHHPSQQQQSPQFSPAQWLALQAQQQQQQQQQQQPPGGTGGMNAALMLQAQQRLQQQQQQQQHQQQRQGSAGAGGSGTGAGAGPNMASMMGQGQGEQPWNPAIGMSPAMLQGLAAGQGQGGPMLGGGGWAGGQ